MSTPRRGRPREFDEIAVLDRAVDVFWSRGVAGTTTRVLEAELGMAQSSIYNAFGSKDQLLHRALDRYLDAVRTQLLVPLLESGPSIDGVVRFVEDLLSWITDEAHPGCLMLNVAAAEGRPDQYVVDRANRYREDLRAAFAAAFESTTVSGDLVLAAVLGLNLAAAGRAPAGEVQAMADSLLDYVKAGAISG